MSDERCYICGEPEPGHLPGSFVPPAVVSVPSPEPDPAIAIQLQRNAATMAGLLARAERAEAALAVRDTERDAEIERLRLVQRDQDRLIDRLRQEREQQKDRRISARAELAAVQATRVRLHAMLALFVDNEPCRFDHHGNCQNHGIGWDDTSPGECSMVAVREALAVRAVVGEPTPPTKKEN